MLNKIILLGIMLAGMAFAQLLDGVPPYMEDQAHRAYCLHDVAWDTSEEGDDDIAFYCDEDEECEDYFYEFLEETCDAFHEEGGVLYYTFEEYNPALAAQAYADLVRAFQQYYSQLLRLALQWALEEGDPRAMAYVFQDYRGHMGDLMECVAEGGHDEEQAVAAHEPAS